MCSRNRLLSLVLTAGLLLGMAQPVAAQDAVAPPSPALRPPQPRPDAPTYGARGPYAVGVRDFIIDAPERRITVTVWYPALNPDSAEEFVTYAMDFLSDPAAGFPTGGRALRDADLDLSGGPYPLVLYSHGAWCFPAIAGFFTEHLASHGFVVMAPVHEDNWGTLFESTWRSEISRPQDMKHVLDFAEKSTAPGGDLADLIDTEHVAATGQSFGGAIALEMGGARLNLAEWQETFCTDFPDDEDCKEYPAHFEEMTALAGLEAIPEDLWPDWSDPRVDVVVASAPAVSMFGGGGLEGMNRPFMLLMGTGDIWVGPGHEHRQFFETLPGPDKTGVFFENADHMIFGNACPAYPGMVDAGFYMICSDQVWDMDRAHDLTNHFATAFLLAELNGDAEAAAALAPENVAFPGILYETTEFGKAGAEPTATLNEATVAKIESMVETMMAENEIPGYALGIVKDGEIVYTKGFGVERIGEDKPVTVHSIFGTGSTGKTATAIAAMQLVEAGKIDLDAPVTTYLPYFKLADERYKDITVRLLLEHRSGLPADPEEWFPLPVAYDDGALEREVRSMDKFELLFAPGEEWSYSSLGMVVLGDIVQKVSGQTFEDYLQENIIDPLGMADTMLIIPESKQSKVSGNHIRNEDGQVVVSDIFPYRRQFTATSPLYSSITGMARFAAANLNRGEFEGVRILPEATYDEMWQPISKMTWDLGPIMNQTIVDYGMTWMLGEIDGHQIVSFGGMDEGFGGDMLLAPEDGIAVVMATNYFDYDEFNWAPWETAIEVMQTLLAEGQ